MLPAQLVPSAQKRKFGLHLLLLIGVVLYVYSPLLDHWLGREYYTRPHTHIHLPAAILVKISTHHHVDSQDHLSEHSDHEDEDNVLCVLDIKTLVDVVLDASITFPVIRNVPLIFDVFPYALNGSSVYLPLLIPPPCTYA